MVTEGCIFCNIAKNLKPGTAFLETDNCFVLPDIKPATKGHSLIISKQHYKNLMETEDLILEDAIKLVKKTAQELLIKYPNIKGFNYISNQNKEAKQVIFHLHIHIIPRY